jgi:hypothetical protein
MVDWLFHQEKLRVRGRGIVENPFEIGEGYDQGWGWLRSDSRYQGGPIVL